MSVHWGWLQKNDAVMIVCGAKVIFTAVIYNFIAMLKEQLWSKTTTHLCALTMRGWFIWNCVYFSVMENFIKDFCFCKYSHAIGQMASKPAFTRPLCLEVEGAKVWSRQHSSMAVCKKSPMTRLHRILLQSMVNMKGSWYPHLRQGWETAVLLWQT